MTKTPVPIRELLANLLPIERLDADGLALYRAAMATEGEANLRRAAVALIEHMCERGHMRRLARSEADGLEFVTYRNLLSLDTLTISLPLEDPEPAALRDTGTPEPEQAHRSAEDGRTGPSEAERGEAVRAVLTMPFLRSVAAASRRTDLAGAVGYLEDLLKNTTGCDKAVMAMSKGLANSQAGNLTEFADVCVSDEGGQVAPAEIREIVESSGTPLSIQDIRNDPRHARYFSGGAAGSLAVAPLKAEAYVYGTLGIWSRRTHAFDPNTVAIVDFIAEFVAGLIKRRLEVEELIFIDQTTQIHNRRYFDEQLEREIERAKRTNEPMALLIGDLDDFKRVNDTLGHAAGDSVLRQVGKILTENARQVDIVARYGGEEFGVILPGVSRESTLAVAERIRRAIAAHSFITGSAQKPACDLTISIGAALYPLDAASRVELMDKADRIALYRAKDAGKNRVVMYLDTQS